MRPLLDLHKVRGFITALLLTGCATCEAVAQAAPIGTFANSSARELEFICAGCVNPSRSAWSDDDGGWGVARAEVGQVDPGRFSGMARATLSPAANSLPVLAVSASADVLVEPGPIIPKVFLYAAGATAQGFQAYRYLGNESTTYTIDYSIDGSITGGPTDATVNTNAIRGGVTVSLGLYDPTQEGVVHVLGQSQRSAKGTGGVVQVALSDSVSFDVGPFETFTAYAFLAASASSMTDGSPGSAIAGNTMHVVFSGGDTSLLEVLTASPVPEPSQPWLFVAGLVALAGFGAARRRRAA